MNRRLSITAFALLTAAAGYGGWFWITQQPSTTAPAEPAVITAAADGSVFLNAAQLRAQTVETLALRTATALHVDGLPAQAMPSLAASSQVAVPYAGVVTAILVDEGARVRSGQALARIQSKDVLAAETDLARTRTEAATAALQARRDATLFAEGIIAAARNEQSQARSAAAQSELQQAHGALARLRPVRGGQAGEYELLAPMAGQVMRHQLNQLTLGQAVAALETVFVVAESGQLDISFSAPLRLRPELRPGLEVRLPDGSSAHVVAVGTDVDPASQSLRVRARMDAGQAGQYAAGQQFSVTLLLAAPAGSFIIPSSALLPAHTGYLLYVAEPVTEANANGMRIRAVHVQLMGQNGTDSVVRVAPTGIQPAASQASLAVGMQVVTRGTALLKAMIPAL